MASCYALGALPSHISMPRFSSLLQFGTMARRSRRSCRAKTRLTTTTKCEAGKDEVPFGYKNKDVLIIGAGITAFGFALKSGLELAGLDPLKSGNVVQLVMVLGLTVGWLASYVFRVANKDMTYAKQLKDYEMKVMEKRYQELPEAELEAMLAQVEEEKERLRRQNSKTG